MQCPNFNREMVERPARRSFTESEAGPLLAGPEQWLRVRKQLTVRPAAYAELLAMAEGYLASPGYAVTDKKCPPPGGSLHDYASLSKYYWPNPDTPDHLPWIVRDGIRNPAADDYDFPRFLEFCLAVTTLAGAAKLTGERKYAVRAADLLRRWFLNPATRMNPDLNHAQFSPGNFPASPSGVIDFHFFCELLEAVRLLGLGDGWGSEDREGLRNWFREFSLCVSTSPLTRREESARNNHGTWYDLLYVSIALFTGDRQGVLRQFREHSIPRLDSQIDANAAMPFEEERTLSLTYCYFNLLGWSWLAGLGKTLGIDLWHHKNRHGATLRQVCLRLLPAFLGKVPWKGRQIAPPPRDIEYCRLFAVVSLLDEIPEIRDFLGRTTANPIWRLPCFMTDDDWQQPPRGSEQEKAFLSSLSGRG